MNAYTFEFEIDELPKTVNAQSSMHWRRKGEYVRCWHSMVAAKLAGNKPEMPLLHARLTLTRLSSVEPDFDGLVSSFKPVIDGLIVCGVIANDRPSNIGQSRYLWAKARPGKGGIKVKIESIE